MKKSLVNEADRVFSLYIRNRGARFGYNHCFTCGAYLPVEELQCGHFRGRGHFSTRWHEFNCWPQCNHCNVELGGNLKVYKEKLISLYGEDAVDGIYILSYQYIPITDDYLREIIKKYK
jgi:hypothetical protein